MFSFRKLSYKFNKMKIKLIPDTLKIDTGPVVKYKVEMGDMLS